MNTATLPEGYVVHLPQAAAPRHLFGERTIVSPDKSISGYEQHERACLTCRAVRVTVVPKLGDPWREWREDGATTQSRWPVRCSGLPAPGP